MTANENNIVDFIVKFKSQGYTDNFIIEEGELKSTITGETFGMEDFSVDAACRFDITENTTDEQHLYSVTTPKGKGLIVDLLANYLYDYYDIFEPKFEGIEIERHLVEEAKEHKYGLPKIYKAEFEINPERFELRIGFPDFPNCPFNNSFSMLGYDKANKEYVWLVTSIIRDKRLNRVYYEG